MRKRKEDSVEAVAGAFRAEEADKGRSGLPAHERLLRHIRQAIGRGELPLGGQLRLRESFRRDYELSNTTIQKAFTRLVEDGFVVSHGRLGTFVAERPPNRFRIALAFNRTKAEALANKHCLALATVAAACAEQVGKTLASYYGDFEGDVVAADERLFADLRAERLAGVIWIAPASMVSAESRAAAAGIPNVFCQAVAVAADFPPQPEVSTVDLVGFIPRATEEIARLGGRRVAVLTFAEYRNIANEYGRLLQAAGLESRSIWRLGVAPTVAEWAVDTVQVMFSLPEDRRPDSLIIADDNLADAAIAGLAGMGLLGKVKVVCHANFPLLSPAPLPIRRVGFDCREVLRVCVETIDRLKNTGGTVHIGVPARSEDEVAESARLSQRAALRAE